MTRRPQPHDRRIHADALRRQDRNSQWSRLKRQVGVMLATIALGAVAAPYAMLNKDQQWAAGVYAYARGTLWVASSFFPNPTIRVRYNGTTYRLPARAVIADRYYRGAISGAVSEACIGGILGFAVWASCMLLFRGAVKRRRDWALRDRIIAGTLVTTEKQLARLTGADADSRALTIGTVPIPSRLETRHLAMIGTTGSGKTTALRQMLDGIEARGEAALVYDTSGEFIAHYYRPERGDVILNPFDERCAYWSPFGEIAHPADADRIAISLSPRPARATATCGWKPAVSLSPI